MAVAAALLVLASCGPGREERERKLRETALVQAVSAGNEAAVAEALAADPALVTAVDETGGRFVRPLHEAIRKGNVALVRLLLERGVGPNVPEANGLMPLHEWAQSEAKEEILDLLTARKADLEAADRDGDRPLHFAVRRRKGAAAVELLLQKGARKESRNGQERTPLLEAAVRADFRPAVPLCAWGADISAHDAGGRGLADLVSRSLASAEDRAAAGRFFGPEGGCARLVAHHRTDGVAPLPAREAAVEENDCALWSAFACGELAQRYDQGNGVPTDLAKGVALFSKGCDGGAAWSCGKLAFRLETGRGTVRDLPRAIALYERACAAGEAWCCANRGVLAAGGEDGPRDDARAARWYDTACRGGHLEACAWLGRLHAAGRGVPKDLERARELFRKACEGREREGCEGLAALDRAQGR